MPGLESSEPSTAIADGSDDGGVSDPSDLAIDSSDERDDGAAGIGGDETGSVKEESESLCSDDDEEYSSAGDSEGEAVPAATHIPNPLFRPGGVPAPSPKLKAFWQKFVVPKHGGDKDPMSEDDSESGSSNDESAPPNPPPPTPTSATSESDKELDECEAPESDDSADGMESVGNGGDTSDEESEEKDLNPTVSEELFFGEMEKGSIANHAKAG